MSQDKKYLLTPGPTPIPEEVLRSMAKPIIHHRTPQYKEIFKEVNENLKYVFKTENDILTFTSSGTGAMEAAVINLLSENDEAIVVRGGKFGERFAEICEAYKITTHNIDVTWGEAVDPDLIKKALENDREGRIKAVFTTLCETSTGVTNDIEVIGKIVGNSKAVLVVDAISGLGSVRIDTDGWGVDVVVSGSQKGLMIPPGLSFVSVSKKAWGLVEGSKTPKFYFDFKPTKKALDKNDSAFTPAITLMIALNESLKLIKKEGIDNVISRCEALADATRKAMLALGLELFAPNAASSGITSVKVPEGVDGAKLVKDMRDKYGVSIAGGQGDLKGKIFRIAHMGYINKSDIKVAVSYLEVVLSELGYNVEKGAGVNALAS